MTDIFSFIKTEETAYQTLPVEVIGGYSWNMFDHIRKTLLYKNSKFASGADDGSRPFKNIIRPILNLQYRAEGFDVKDIVLFINDSYKYFKSFLVKKYHEVWARENGIDTFIDKVVENYCDFGGVLVKDVNEIRPEVVPWSRIAFCDQTDILSGPIAEKHFYAPDQLKEMESKGWGKENNGATGSIDDVIILSTNEKKEVANPAKPTRTPSKYIEVYEIHGVFPKWYLAGEENDDDELVRQLHIITFYKDEKGDKKGITLYRGKEKKLPYKILLRDEIYGRALGMGGAEELFEPQVWVNYDQISIKNMLDAASKTLHQTDDQSFKNKNKLNNLENNEVLVLEEGKSLSQVNTQPVNLVAFDNSLKEWEMHARQMGAATESIMGESPTSGTPFKLQELITAESHSLHEYRKGKIATFIDEVYRDWIIPHIVREITKGKEFLAELELDELQQVADTLVICESNKVIKEKILNGELISQDEIDKLKQETRDAFMKGGNKRFLQIFKDEMKDAPISVKTNVAGKQKNLSAMTDKLVNVFRQMLSTYNPQTGSFAIFDDPRMSKLFNQIIEYSGLSPIDFYQKPKEPQQIQPQILPQQMVASPPPQMAMAQ